MADEGVGCSLGAYGSEFDIDEFLASSSLKAYAVWHKGEKPLKRQPPVVHSGASFAIGSAAALSDQVAETIEFLETHHCVLSRLRDTPGVEFLVLDFGISRRIILVETHRLPLDLIVLAAELRMRIDLTVFAASEEIFGDGCDAED